MASKRAPKVASQEQVFLEFVQQIDRHRTGRLALVVTLSPIETARGLQATQNLVCDQIKRHLTGKQFELFRFGRGDIAVMTKDVPDGLARDTAFGLIFRLKDETFFDLFDDGEEDLCRILDAEADYDILLAYAKAGLQGDVELPGRPLATLVIEEKEHGASSKDEPASEIELVKLSPDEVSVFGREKDNYAGDDYDESEEGDDGKSVVLETRREEIVVIPEEGESQSLMALVGADGNALEERFLFDADKETKASYFPRILQQAEQQLLTQITHQEPQPAELALMVQVRTLLSAEFLTFDRARAAAGAWPRAYLILDRDALRGEARETYQFARDFVEGRGYELGLSGINFRALPRVRLKDQGFAFQLVEWDADEAAFVTAEDRAGMRKGVEATGSPITVLTNCNQEEAIEFGHKLGIRHFVGSAASAILTRASFLTD